jgi:addiction module HigA family antidote
VWPRGYEGGGIWLLAQNRFGDYSPLQLSQYRVSKDIKVPPRRINEIVHGKRSITADTALRFSVYFGTSAQFWLNLQSHYDLENEKDKSFTRIGRDVQPLNIPHKKAA